MTRHEVNQRYFQWICRSVCGRYFRKRDYQLLLRHLHDVPFHYTIGMDGNRAADGVNLRYRFANERGYEYPMIEIGRAHV